MQIVSSPDAHGANRRRWKFIVGAALLFFALKWWFRPPSEAQLKARFVEQRAEFEQLRKMVEHDALAARYGVHLSSRDNAINQDPVLPPARAQRYRVLMRKVGIYGIHGNKERFRMPVFGGGFTDTSWSIGYAFCSRKPTVIVPSVYHRSGYSPLSGDWYLFNSR